MQGAFCIPLVILHFLLIFILGFRSNFHSCLGDLPILFRRRGHPSDFPRFPIHAAIFILDFARIFTHVLTIYVILACFDDHSSGCSLFSRFSN